MKKISFFWKFANGRTERRAGEEMHAHILELCFTNATFIISHQTPFLSCYYCSYTLASVLWVDVKNQSATSQCLKIIEKVALSIASEASSKSSAKAQQKTKQNWNETFWVIFNQCVLLQKQDDGGGVKHEFQIPTAKFTIHKDESICKTSLKAALTSEAICQIPKFFCDILNLQIVLKGGGSKSGTLWRECITVLPLHNKDNN